MKPANPPAAPDPETSANSRVPHGKPSAALESQPPTRNSSSPLPTPRHEAFAHEIASGQSATQAYINVYRTENRRVASTGGSRLLRRKPIAARIKALQKAGATRVALDLAEILDFLARVVRTPAGEVSLVSGRKKSVKPSFIPNHFSLTALVGAQPMGLIGINNQLTRNSRVTV